MELKTYHYYSITDLKKESLDRVQAFNTQQALEYFAKRKQMLEGTFSQLYRIEIYDESK